MRQARIMLLSSVMLWTSFSGVFADDISPSALRRILTYLNQNKGKIALTAGATALLGALAYSQYELGQNQVRVEERHREMLQKLEGVYDGLGSKLNTVEKKVDAVGEKVDALKGAITSAVSRLEEVYRQGLIQLSRAQEGMERSYVDQVKKLEAVQRDQQKQLQSTYDRSLREVKDQHDKALRAISRTGKNERKEMQSFIVKEQQAGITRISNTFTRLNGQLKTEVTSAIAAVAKEQGAMRKEQQASFTGLGSKIDNYTNEVNVHLQALQTEVQRGFSTLESTYTAVQTHMDELMSGERTWHEGQYKAVQKALGDRYDTGVAALKKSHKEEARAVEALFQREITKAMKDGKRGVVDALVQQKTAYLNSLNEHAATLCTQLQQKVLLLQDSVSKGFEKSHSTLEDMVTAGNQLSQEVKAMHDANLIPEEYRNSEMLWRFVRSPQGQKMIQEFLLKHNKPPSMITDASNRFELVRSIR